MKNQPVISEYTDQQAIEDGILVAYEYGDIDRVSANVWHTYVWVRPVRKMGKLRNTADTKPLQRLCQIILGELKMEMWKVYQDGAFTVAENGEKKFWAVVNERGKLTLMMPEDY